MFTYGLLFCCFALVASQPHGNSLLFFRYVKPMWHTNGFLSVRLPFSISRPLSKCDEMKSATALLIQKTEAAEPSKVSPLHQLLEHVNKSVYAACDEAQMWRSIFPDRELHRDSHRQRRQIALAVAAGTAFGGFASQLISEICSSSATSRRVNDIQVQLSSLQSSFLGFVNLTTTAARITALADDLALTAQNMYSTARSFSRGLTSVISFYRVTPDLLPVTALPVLWEDIRRHSGTSFNFPFSALSLYELHATLQQTPGGYAVVLQLPRLHIQLSLYRLQPFPVLWNNHTWLLTDMVTEFVALNHARTVYYTPTSAELHSCHTIGRTLLCPFPFLRLQYSEQCLSSLFVGHSQGYSRCQRSKPTDPWYLTQGEGNGWHLFTTIHMEYVRTCAGKAETTVLRPGFHSITVPDTCDVTSRYFSIPTKISQVITARDIIKPFLPDLPTITTETFQLPDLTTASTTAEPSSTPPIWSVSAVIISSGCASLMLAFLILLYCVYRRSTRTVST